MSIRHLKEEHRPGQRTCECLEVAPADLDDSDDETTDDRKGDSMKEKTFGETMRDALDGLANATAEEILVAESEFNLMQEAEYRRDRETDDRKETA